MTWSLSDVEDEWEAGKPLTIEELEEGLELLEDMVGILAAGVTGGGDPRRYRQVRAQLKRLLRRAEIKMPYRWSSLDEWTEFGKTKFPRDYAGRRTYIQEITEPVRVALQQRLEEAEDGDLPGEMDELDELATDAVQDPSAIAAELRRVRGLLRSDPSAAIGKAKNLVEATAKAVLVEFEEPVIGHSMNKLVNKALQVLDLDPDPRGKLTEAEVMRLLKQLSTSVNELRNLVGDGHAAETAVAGVELRHGRLVVRAALAWCSFMLETLQAQQADW